MTDYRRVELKRPGDELVMQVDQVFFNPKAEKHKYPDFTFRGTDPNGEPVMLYVPEQSCRRQFSRSPLSTEPENAGGLTLRFYRKANPEDEAKPYWNVELADKAAPPTKRLTEPAVEAEAATNRPTLGDGVKLYRWAWNAAKDVQGKEGTSDSIQAGAATLIIWADHRGLSAVPALPRESKRVPSPFEEPPDLEEEDAEDSIPF